MSFMRHSRPFHAALAAALLLSWLPATPSAQIDTSLFAGLRWRSIGPNRGGRSQTSAGSASRPLEYYFGATGGGVWKTTDGGLTWRAVSDKQLKTSSVGALAISPSNPDVVYAGMGETELRGNIIQGDGVYKTADAGKTWTSMGLEKTAAIARLRVHPSNPDVLYAGMWEVSRTPHSLSSGGPGSSLYKPTDGATTWTDISKNAGLPRPIW